MITSTCLKMKKKKNVSVDFDFVVSLIEYENVIINCEISILTNYRYLRFYYNSRYFQSEQISHLVDKHSTLF